MLSLCPGWKIMPEKIAASTSPLTLSDWISLSGTFVSLVGFILTLLMVYRSKAAADTAIAKLRGVNVVADLSSIVVKLDELKRIHRQNKWLELPDRYSDLRTIIITIKHSNADLTDDEKTILQHCISQLRTIGTEVEREIQKDTQDNRKLVRYNDILSSITDAMHEIVCEAKRRIGG